MEFSVFLFLYMAIYGQAHEDHHHKISDEEHYKGGGTHDSSYDHDAFLGKTHGHDFDNLEPEDAKRRLKEMLKKVDLNSDFSIDFDELRDWIDKQRISYMWETHDMLINRDDEDKDGDISWLEYKHAHYGKWDGTTEVDPKLQVKIDKTEKKFKIADINQDGKLNRDEYGYFRHPEESRDQRLQDIAIDEVIDDMDQNDDRKIDQEEFLGQYVGEDGKPPEWVLDDRKHFNSKLDKNKNGVLDRDEIRAWVLPDREDSVKESKHLISSADDNEDRKLSVEEILDHYSLFVGSTATDHGRALRNEL